jgi:hypothetical protein
MEAKELNISKPYQLSCEVVSVSEERVFETSNMATNKARELTVKVANGKVNEFFSIDFYNNKTNLLHGLKEGQKVIVVLRLKGRLSNKMPQKAFNGLEGEAVYP